MTTLRQWRTTMIVGLALLVVSPSAALPQPARRAMDPADVITLPGVSDPQVSPDGLSVAYVERRPGIDLSIWIVDVATRERRLLARPGNKPRWSGDGSRMAFLARAGTVLQVHVANVDGSGASQKLTDLPAGVTDFAWSDAEDKIALISAVPPPTADRRTSVLDPQRDGRPVARIHVVGVPTSSVEAPATSPPITPAGRHVLALAWSPDGGRIVYAAWRGPALAAELTTELYMLAVPAGAESPAEPVRLTTNDRTECHSILGCALVWAPDGSVFFYLEAAGVYPPLGPTKIRIRGAELGAKPGRYLPDHFPGYVKGGRWTANGEAIVFWATAGTARQIYRVSRDGRRLDTLTGPDALRGPFSVSRDGRRFAFIKEEPVRLPDVHVADLAPDGRSLIGERALTDMSSAVDAFQLGETRHVSWKGSDGRHLEGLVVLPVAPTEPGRAAPLIVNLHGGPDSAVSRGFQAGWGSLPHVYAARGYITFFPNFRGSANYGAAFTAANVGDLGGGDARDVVTGIQELVRRGLADPNRVGLQGWSYGGYLTAWLIGHAREHGIRYAAATIGGGLANAISHYSQADIQWARELYHQGTPWRRPSNMLERSPLFALHRARTPTIIFHGRKDERVPVAQAYEMYMGLRQALIPLRLVIYEMAAHSPTEPSDQQHKMECELEWFETYVAGRGSSRPCTPAP